MSISINRSGAFAAFMSIVQNSAAGAVFFDELRFVFGENRHGLSGNVCRGRILRRLLTFSRRYV